MAGGSNDKPRSKPSEEINNTQKHKQDLSSSSVTAAACSQTQQTRRVLIGNDSDSRVRVGGVVQYCSGTVGSFNNYGSGSQNFKGAKINSGKISKQTTQLPDHSSGTRCSFNNYGKGSQSFSGAKINSCADSGDYSTDQ